MTTASVPIGLYHPGRSLLHRTPTGVKLVLMFAAIVTVTFSRTWLHIAIAAGGAAALYLLARIPPRIAWSQLRPLRYVLIVVAALQVWLSGPLAALLVCGTVLVTVALAALITLTTPMTAMLDAVATALGPLRRFGVRPDRIGLLLAMTIRCIPLVIGIVGTVSQAAKARGVGSSLRALAAPTVIRSLRAADALGEALLARGADD